MTEQFEELTDHDLDLTEDGRLKRTSFEGEYGIMEATLNEERDEYIVGELGTTYEANENEVFRIDAEKVESRDHSEVRRQLDEVYDQLNQDDSESNQESEDLEVLSDQEKVDPLY